MAITKEINKARLNEDWSLYNDLQYKLNSYYRKEIDDWHFNKDFYHLIKDEKINKQFLENLNENKKNNFLSDIKTDSGEPLGEDHASVLADHYEDQFKLCSQFSYEKFEQFTSQKHFSGIFEKKKLNDQEKEEIGKNSVEINCF